MTRAFLPRLEELVVSLARRRMREIWADAFELSRLTLEAVERSGATHALFPFDDVALAEAAGAQTVWEDVGPAPVAGAPITPELLDPNVALRAGRIPLATDACKHITSRAGLAAHVPAPAKLASQIGATDQSLDLLLDCTDLVVGYARGLVEAGASMIVVSDLEIESEGIDSLRRLAELYRIPMRRISDPTVLVWPVDQIVADAVPAFDFEPYLSAEVVITDRPLPGDVNLAKVARAAAFITGN